MNEALSIENQDLIYISIYDKETGERKTSFVTGIHAETAEELQKIANEQYPNDIRLMQTASEYNNALQNDLIYKNGELVSKPTPTEDELREQQLSALDNEYSTKISEVEVEMAKAKAIEDEDYYQDLKDQRKELVTEYTDKREVI